MVALQLLCLQYPATSEAREEAVYQSDLLAKLLPSLASKLNDIIAAANNNLELARTEDKSIIIYIPESDRLKENDKVVFSFSAPKTGTIYLEFLQKEDDKENVPMYMAIRYSHPHHVQLDCYENGTWRLVAVGSGFDFTAERVTITVKVGALKYRNGVWDVLNVYSSGYGLLSRWLARYPLRASMQLESITCIRAKCMGDDGSDRPLINANLKIISA